MEWSLILEGTLGAGGRLNETSAGYLGLTPGLPYGGITRIGEFSLLLPMNISTTKLFNFVGFWS